MILAWASPFNWKSTLFFFKVLHFNQSLVAPHPAVINTCLSVGTVAARKDMECCRLVDESIVSHTGPCNLLYNIVEFWVCYTYFLQK